MDIIICCNCHVPFAVPRELDQALQRCHNTFYCPKGHAQSYTGKSDLEKAQDQLWQAKRELSTLIQERDALKKKGKKKK